jgi:prolyl 4-hydroxylase
MIFLHRIIFWDTNRDKAKPENWPAGNTYTNHWEAPSTIVNIEDKTMKGGGFVLKQTTLDYNENSRV